MKYQIFDIKIPPKRFNILGNGNFFTMETLAEVDIKTKKTGKLDILKPQKKYFSLSDVTGKRDSVRGIRTRKLLWNFMRQRSYYFLHIGRPLQGLRFIPHCCSRDLFLSSTMTEGIGSPSFGRKSSRLCWNLRTLELGTINRSSFSLFENLILCVVIRNPLFFQ